MELDSSQPSPTTSDETLREELAHGDSSSTLACETVFTRRLPRVSQLPEPMKLAVEAILMSSPPKSEFIEYYARQKNPDQPDFERVEVRGVKRKDIDGEDEGRASFELVEDDDWFCVSHSRSSPKRHGRLFVPSEVTQALGAGSGHSVAPTHGVVLSGCSPAEAYAKLVLNEHRDRPMPSRSHTLDSFVSTVCEPDDSVLLSPIVESANVLGEIRQLPQEKPRSRARSRGNGGKENGARSPGLSGRLGKTLKMAKSWSYFRS